MSESDRYALKLLIEKIVSDRPSLVRSAKVTVTIENGRVYVEDYKESDVR